MHHKGFYLFYFHVPWEWKKQWKNVPGSNRSNREVGNTAVGRYIWYIWYISLLFLNLTLGWNTCGNLAYPENWAFLYETLTMLATKKNVCSLGNCTSLSSLNKKLLSKFNFVPKIDELLLKIYPISHNLVKHKQYWMFNITQSLCVRRNCIFEDFWCSIHFSKFSL